MMLFDDRFADTPVGALSGGERNRVQLARLLRRGGNLLVLDEPTNDLDLVTLGVLEDALAQLPRLRARGLARSLVPRQDRDRHPGVRGRRRVGFYEGDWSAWHARAADAARAPTPPGRRAVDGARRPRPSRGAAPAKRKLTFKEKQELDGIEAAIATAESKTAELQQSSRTPRSTRPRAAEVPALVAALDGARAEVDRLYARWEELEALR